MNRISQNISALLLYTVMVSLIFFGVITGKGVFYAGDIQQHYVPWETFVDEQFSKGELPLWNPEIFGGHPIHAEGQSGILYPVTRAVYRIFDGARAFSLDMLLHLVLGGFFVYLLGRRINLGYYPSLYAGAVYSIAGYPVNLILNAPIMRSAAWIPLIALLVLSIWQGGRLRPTVFLAFAIAMQILAGSMQVVAMTLVMILFLSMFMIISMLFRGTLHLSSIIWIALVAIPLGFLVASVQVLPSFNLYQKSSIRAQADASMSLNQNAYAIQESEALDYSFSPYHLLDMFTPPFWAQDPQILARSDEIPFQMTLFLYIGTVPFFLALIGFLLTKSSNIWRFLALIGILMALGGYTFFYPTMLKVLPMLEAFRAPDRYLFMYAISAAILAGYGFRLFLGKEMPEDPAFKRKWLIPSAIIAAILLAGGLFLDNYYLPGIIEDTYENLKTGLFSRINFNIELSNLSLILKTAQYQLLVSLLLLITLGIATVSLWTSRYRAMLVGTLIFVLSFIEVGYYLKSYPGTRLISPSYFNKPPASVEVIKSHQESEEGQTIAPYRIHSIGAFEHGISTFGHDNFMLWYHGGGKQSDYYRFREILNPNYGNVFDLHYISGISSLYTASWDRYMHLVNVHEDIFIQQPNFFNTRVHFWDLSGVKYIVSNTRLPDGRLRLLDSGDVYVYENQRVLPRALVLYPQRVYPESEQVINELMLGRLSLVDNLVLSTGRESSYRRGSLTETRKYSNVIIESYDPKRVVIRGSADIDGYLILTDAFDAGWRCTVNDEVKPVYRAYSYFRAVPISAGPFKAVFEYKPSDFQYGLIFTIISLAIWFVLLIISIVRPQYTEELD